MHRALRFFLRVLFPVILLCLLVVVLLLLLQVSSHLLVSVHAFLCLVLFCFVRFILYFFIACFYLSDLLVSVRAMQQRRSNFFDQMPGVVSKLLDSLCSRFGVQFDESVLTLSRHGSVSSSASSSQSTRGIDYRVVIFGSSSQTGKPVSGLDLNNWYLLSLFLAVFFLIFLV